jgi:hypothetical protein
MLVQQANPVYDHVKESMALLGPSMKRGLNIGTLVDCMFKLLEEIFRLLFFLKLDGIQLLLEIFIFVGQLCPCICDKVDPIH